MGKSSNNKKVNNLENACKFTISKDIPSYANDPTVIKRGDASKEFLDRVGFPEELVRLWKERQAKSKNNASE